MKTLILILFPLFVSSQAIYNSNGSIAGKVSNNTFYNATGAKIGSISNNLVFDSFGKLAYSFNQNIIFDARGAYLCNLGSRIMIKNICILVKENILYDCNGKIILKSDGVSNRESIMFFLLEK